MISFDLLWLIPCMPLLGAAINGSLGAKLQRRFGEKTVGFLGVTCSWASFVLAVMAFIVLIRLPEGGVLSNRLWDWVMVGDFRVELAFSLDRLSGMMVLMVTLVGSLIHVYSLGYMRGDAAVWRFFCYLNLFMFSMLTLILADNLVLMFVGWEGVGLCSYLLIGFWYHDRNNARAGMKAFVVNRVGDFGFLVGLFILFWGIHQSFSSGGYQSTGVYNLSFRELPSLMQAISGQTLWGIQLPTLIGIFFFVGACGKSAQIPLYVWLPDAMAGPTPVSALIHAATMVTAGVYMVARMNFLYVLSPTAMTVVAMVGAATALFAATIGCFQNDIKKVLAYSTISQLGYMFVGVGVGAFWAGSYHLLTHAFFKACLFLGAGSVILAMHHQQDMQKMGGLAKTMPFTRWTYWFACVAISGFPIASGFYSKDEILWQAFNCNGLLVPGWFIWLLGLAAAGLTAFYMWRSYFLTFSGALPQDTHGHEPEEQPHLITGVLALLAVGAFVMLFLGIPKLWMGTPPALEQFLAPSFTAAEHSELAKVYGPGQGHGTEWLLMLISLLVATVGLSLAWKFYRGRSSQVPQRLLQKFPRIHRVVYNKYYVDEFYQATAIRGFMGTSRLFSWLDVHLIDSMVNLVGSVTRVFARIDGWIDQWLVDGLVNLVGKAIQGLGGRVRKLQTGRLPNYLAGLAIGGALLFIITRFFMDMNS